MSPIGASCSSRVIRRRAPVVIQRNQADPPAAGALLIEYGVPGMRAAGFHVVSPWVHVVISLQAHASGIDDLRRAMPHNTGNMGMSA